MSVIRWEDPPPKTTSAGGRGKSGVDWRPIVDALRSRPGDWALVATFPAGNIAAQTARLIRRGEMRIFRPAGEFDATARKVDGVCRVYARYVGPGSTSPEPGPVLCDPWCPGCENPIHERAAEPTKGGTDA